MILAVKMLLLNSHGEVEDGGGKDRFPNPYPQPSNLELIKVNIGKVKVDFIKLQYEDRFEEEKIVVSIGDINVDFIEI